MNATPTRKKLIEVALSLDAINKASAREKSIRHGPPSTLQLWWARRPLAAARAVTFAQMVDDPSKYVDVHQVNQKRTRGLLHVCYSIFSAPFATSASRGTVLAVSSPEGCSLWKSTVPKPCPKSLGLLIRRRRLRVLTKSLIWFSQAFFPLAGVPR